MERIAMALAIVALLAGCERSGSPGRPGKELETVDVEARPDVELSTASDERGRAQTETLAGVLPSDFPADVPVFSPSSVVDFGNLSSGHRFVTVDTSVPIAETRDSLGTQLRRAGWRLQGVGGEAAAYVKDDRRIRVALQDLEPGTRIRYEY